MELLTALITTLCHFEPFYWLNVLYMCYNNSMCQSDEHAGQVKPSLVPRPHARWRFLSFTWPGVRGQVKPSLVPRPHARWRFLSFTWPGVRGQVKPSLVPRPHARWRFLSFTWPGVRGQVSLALFPGRTQDGGFSPSRGRGYEAK